MLNPLSHISTDAEGAILNVLKYYSIFNYPIKAEEIQKYATIIISIACITDVLDELVNDGRVYNYNNYYSLSVDIAALVANREKGNRLAAEKIFLAHKAGKLVYKFPFVRFVGISGSLSKGYAQADSDFDFFIITAGNRLWIARTILHLFKKMTFLAGRQHDFCMNYFVDDKSLVLDEKNRFTAIELITLIPVKGHDVYDKLMKSNEWAYALMPNVNIELSEDIYKREPLIKRMAEWIMNKLGGDKLNESLMILTDRSWRKKWKNKNYPMEDYDLAFKTNLHVSKNHPANHQKRVLKLLAQEKNNLE